MLKQEEIIEEEIARARNIKERSEEWKCKDIDTISRSATVLESNRFNDCDLA